MNIIETGGSGNCLFSSLGRELNVDQLELRKIIANYVLKHSNSEIKGTGDSIKYWISLDGQYKCIHDYARSISRSGEWGSALEISLVSKIFKRRIVVWIPVERDPKNGIKSIATYEGNKPTIHLFYSGDHYRVLSFE
jgi:hypothetical protein